MRGDIFLETRSSTALGHYQVLEAFLSSFSSKEKRAELNIEEKENMPARLYIIVSKRISNVIFASSFHVLLACCCCCHCRCRPALVSPLTGLALCELLQVSVAAVKWMEAPILIESSALVGAMISGDGPVQE